MTQQRSHVQSLIRRKGSLANVIFGTPQRHPLENRIFNAVVLMAAFAGICATLLNYYSGNPVRELIITLFATAVSLGFYIASRRFHADRYLKAPLIIIFLGILSTAWMTNQGSDGSTPAYFFILFVVTKIILPHPYDKWMLGVGGAAVFALLWIEHLQPDLIIPYINASHMFLDKVMSLMICLVVCSILAHIILKEYQRERARGEQLYRQTLKDKEELAQALAEIKILRGILPVCSFCKKIRDENDHWCTMESYITSHSEAQFSHGFCPECGRKHYPQYFQKAANQ